MNTLRYPNRLNLNGIKYLVFAFMLVGAGVHTNMARGHEASQSYMSNAGRVMGTYQAEISDRTPETMAKKAHDFLGLLTAPQRKAAQLPLNHPERKSWTNSPVRGEVGGVALGVLNDQQLTALLDLLATLLSDAGLQRVKGSMLGDDLRSIIDGKPNDGVGIEAFRAVIFGVPSSELPWALQLDGHHIALNISLAGNDYSMSPSFFGTYPQHFTVTDQTLKPMSGEVNLAYTFMHSLSNAQQEKALTHNQRMPLRVGRGRDGVTPPKVGLLCDSLNEKQTTLLFQLASQWFGIAPPEHAQRLKQRFLAEIEQTHFSWNGPVATGSDISWAIHTPSLIIEFGNDERGGAKGGNPADHIHSIFRDFTMEYGVFSY